MTELQYFEEKMLPQERGSIPYLETFPEYMRFLTERYGYQIALADGAGPAETYLELAEHVARRRTVLKERGLTPGSMVGLMDANCAAAVEWFLAITTAGCTAVMLPTQLQSAVMPGIGKHYELKAIIAGEACRETTEGAQVPVIASQDMANVPSPPEQTSKSTRAAVFFTGGTTGTPKGVILSHGALLRGSLNGTYREGTVYGQSFVSALPLSHVFGMVFSTLAPLYTGSFVATCPNMRDIFSVMAQVHPTTVIAVPGLADIMLTVAQMKGKEVLGGRLNLIICGAAPVPPRLREGFLPLGIAVDAGYGMTETANLVSGNLDMARYPESVGHAYPCQEIKTVDGELWVRGDMLFDGYWKDEKATQAAFQDGWLRTGDLAKINDEGFIFIVGRIKNLILLPNGENVSPEEVEEAFYRSTLIKDCLAYEDTIGAHPVIALEALAAPGIKDDALQKEIERIARTLPSYLRPAKIIIRHDDFEKTPSLKIKRK